MSSEVRGSGPPIAVRWVDQPEPDALELLDPTGGRATVVARPPEDLPPGEELVALERLAFDWADPATRTEAEFELLSRVAADPVRVLNGLSWILGLWCVLRELRTGRSAMDYARALDCDPLDYHHGPSDAAEAETWRSRVEVARIGVLAALTLDDVAIRVYRKAASTGKNTGPELVRQTLVLMTGLRAEMLAGGLDARGLVAAFVEGTVPATRPRRSFNPSRRV
jgi:hypothetical protein